MEIPRTAFISATEGTSRRQLPQGVLTAEPVVLEDNDGIKSSFARQGADDINERPAISRGVGSFMTGTINIFGKT